MKISFEKYFKILQVQIPLYFRVLFPSKSSNLFLVILFPMKFQIQGSTNEREFSDVFSNIPNFNFTEPILENCPLCKETEEIHQNETARVLFSVKPYKFGHVMVIPKGHVALLDSFSPSELTNIAKLIDDSCQVSGIKNGVLNSPNNYCYISSLQKT